MEKILKYSTVGYALLILFGYSYLDTYFSRWDIQIYSYLDASEILLVFLRKVTSIVFGLIGASSAYLIPTSKLFQKSTNDVDEKLNSVKKKKPIITIVMQVIFVLCILAAILYPTILATKKYNLDFALLPLKILLVFLGATIVYYWLPSLIEKRKISIDLISLRILLIISVMYWLNYLSAIGEYHRVKNEIIKTSVHFSYESDTYQTNDTLIYIGATSKYIFLNNPKSLTNYIFEKENITYLKITEVK